MESKPEELVGFWLPFQRGWNGTVAATNQGHGFRGTSAGGRDIASPMRLSAALVEAVERESAIQKRSVPKQIEFWAELGKTVEGVIDPADVVAVVQGLKKIKVEPMRPTPANPGDVFDSIETIRKSCTLAVKVTSAAIYYEASPSRTGLLDRVNSSTGERQTGQFYNGVFKGSR